MRRLVGIGLIALPLLLPAQSGDHSPPQLTKMGKAVFSFSRDGFVQPIFPAKFRVTPQEPGVVIPQGVVVCDFFLRVRDIGRNGERVVIVHEIIFRCNKQLFLVTATIFQGEP